jgi:hypothetical protein
LCREAELNVIGFQQCQAIQVLSRFLGIVILELYYYFANKRKLIFTVEVTYAASNLVSAMLEHLLLVQIETFFCDSNDFH